MTNTSHNRHFLTMKTTNMENKNITKAILSVMEAVKGIDKSMTVGTGQNSYKGVSDKDVKSIIGDAMQKNGLTLIPIEIEPTLRIDRWEETTNYGIKNKQQVFAEVRTKYLLMHESGENLEIQGYGHGIDSQDKAAGKATTYALKYALLYTFLVPTGKIDDADQTHSNDIEVPQSQDTPTQQPAKELPLLNEDTETFLKAFESVKSGQVTIAQIEKKYKLSKAVKTKLQNAK